MILPLRVFGSSGVKTIFAGFAIGPIFLATCSRSSLIFSIDPSAPRIMTGHANGVITVNIAEADDAERERRRLQMKEPYRTLLGHFRHEIGHYYWDVLIRDSTMTYTRNWELKLGENVVTFYTGQAFMVKKSLNAKAVKDLNGATICMVTGATLELNIADYARSKGVTINSLLFEKTEEAFAAAESGRCDGYSDDTGSLAAARSTMRNPADWVILPEVISKEPLGIHARDGDERWRDILFWTDAALKTAEEFGITQANIDQMKSSNDPFVRRLLGMEGDFGKLLGVDNGWSGRIVKDIGNYGEVYEATFGKGGLGLPRGMNNLWDKGGLQALPTWH